MPACSPTLATTGFEDIEATRNTLQIIATIVILLVVVIMQLMVFLLLLPIPQVPRVLRALDFRFEVLDLADSLHNEKQQEEGRKRAAGGLASAAVFAVIVVISMTTLVITNDEPGAVTYSSNKIMGSLDGDIDTTFGAVFTLPLKINANQSVVLVAGHPNKFTYCQLQAVNGSRQTFSADLYQSFQRVIFIRDGLYPLTVCAPINGKLDIAPFGLEIFTPVDPPLKAYPPPGVFNDVSMQEEFKAPVGYWSEVTVLNMYKNWTEMISTSPLDLLAAVTTKRWLQMKISMNIGTRRVNSTYNEFGPPEYWPECYMLNTANTTYRPLFSIMLHHKTSYSNNMSFVVSQTSLVSWAFTTIITIGSIVALKPSIVHYVTKLSEYWKMKPAVRWALFALYTAVVPLPLVFVLVGSFDARHSGYRREAYLEEYLYLLLTVTCVLLLTWVGMFVRHVKFEVDRRRALAVDYSALSEESEIALPHQPQYGTIVE